MSTFLSDVRRLWRIATVVWRYGLDELISLTPQGQRLSALFRWIPSRFKRSETRQLPRGERFRRALEELGPVFIKLGQMLSTRRDLLPDDIALELTRLQDRVPPFSGEIAKQQVEQALGMTLTQAFNRFDVEPLASASIAQVHAAELPNGDEVVVKVLRPGIEKIIRHDVSLLNKVAAFAERFLQDGHLLKPRDVVQEYEKTILDELDLVREAANAAQTRRNFADSEMLYVPSVYWDYTRQNVMVMERIHGIPVNDVEAIRQRGVDLEKLAQRGVEIFFTQVFRDNFFHADMHGGNIFVDPDRTDNPRYIAIDFGIVGSLTREDRRYLAENLLAFFKRDYERVAQLYVDSGWVSEETRVEELASAIRAVSEPIFEKPLSEISFGMVLVRLFQTARRFNITVQPQLVLLEKTLLYIEGLGRQVYPQLDLWKTAKPFLERWMSEQVGFRAAIRQIEEHSPRWLESLPQLPQQVHQFLAAGTRQGRQAITQQDLLAFQAELRRQSQQQSLVIVGVSLLLAASVIYGLDGLQPDTVLGVPLLSWGLGGVGMVTLLTVWQRRLR